MFTFMDWVAYQQGQYGCSSPSNKVLHDQGNVKNSSVNFLDSSLGSAKMYQEVF